MLRMKEMCTPRPRWMPEHWRQMKMPNLGEACVPDEGVSAQREDGWEGEEAGE